MKINIEFLVVCYFVGLFVDWVFQSQEQAANKSKWNKEDNKWRSFKVVFMHSFIYAWFTTCFTVLICGDINKYLILVTLFVTHLIIDTRIPVKWILRLKGMSKEQIADYQNYGFMHIGIDHRLHELVILILALIV